MTREQVLLEFENSLEEPPEPGSLRGDEVCEELDGWNSLAVLSFIAVINKKTGITLEPARIIKCRTVGEILDLVQAGSDR